MMRTSLACVCVGFGLLMAGACGHAPDVDHIQPGAAVTVTEQNGTAVKGRVVRVTPDAVVVQVTPNERRSVARKTISGVQVSDSDTAASTAGAPAAVDPPAVAYRELTVPAGTQIALTLGTRVGSQISQTGDPVRASLDAPIVVDGVEVVPSNAAVAGRVVTARGSGRVKGRAELGLQFDHLSVGDRDYAIQATLVSREAASTHKKDALSIGVPAAAGTIIGAIAGGKKGALVGGAVAGGAGTAYVLATPGKEVLLPEGTRIHATLTEPLTIRVPANR